MFIHYFTLWKLSKSKSKFEILIRDCGNLCKPFCDIGGETNECVEDTELRIQELNSELVQANNSGFSPTGCGIWAVSALLSAWFCWFFTSVARKLTFPFPLWQWLLIDCRVYLINALRWLVNFILNKLNVVGFWHGQFGSIFLLGGSMINKMWTYFNV